MKKGFLYSILLITLLCSNVVATPIAIPLSSFSGTETVINFDSIGNEVPITNQFSVDGVIFNGALYGMTNPPDVNKFLINGNVVIASNAIYGQTPNQTPGLQGNSFSATFDSITTKVGFYFVASPEDDASVTVRYNGVSSGSLTFNTGSPTTAIFVGLEESLGFNSITLTVAANDNGYFAIDNFRFEGLPNITPGPEPVPEPSTLLLLSIGVTGLIGLKKRIYKQNQGT